MYKPNKLKSWNEGKATLDWLLTHSLKHIIWNWLKAKIYHRSGKFNHIEED